MKGVFSTIKSQLHNYYRCDRDAPEQVFAIEELKTMEPKELEELFYPPSNLQRKDIPLPDFKHYYERIHAKGSRVNISYCWLDYRSHNPDGYGQTQFYELYNRYVEKEYGKSDVKIAVERIPGEKLYIDWVGDHPELLYKRCAVR